MARNTFPHPLSQMGLGVPETAGASVLSAAGASCVVYADADGITPADIETLAGDPVVDSTLILDAWSRIPSFLGPADGSTELYVSVDDGPISSVYAISAFGAAAGGNFQPLDDELTAIAAIDPSAAGTIATDGAGWVKKTWGQVKTLLALGKADVGLANVDNTSDANKPISTATQAALDGKADLVGGKVPSSQMLPISLFQIETVANQAARLALAAGESYLVKQADTGAWWAIDSSKDPSVAGNWVSVDVDPSAAVDSVNGHVGVVVLGKADVGLGNVDNTSDAGKPISTATQAALDGKQPLDADLTALAGLDSSQVSAIASDGAGWVRKSVAQFKAWLGMTAADVGALPVPGTAPTAGQLFASDGAGGVTPVNPSGTSELLYAENNTGTQQTGLTNGTFDITGCSGAVPTSPRPVYLHGYVMQNVTAGNATGTTLRLDIVEVSNGVDTPVTIEGDAIGNGTGVQLVAIPATRLATSTARPRTFKLSTVVSATVTLSVSNGATSRRSVLAAEAR